MNYVRLPPERFGTSMYDMEVIFPSHFVLFAITTPTTLNLRLLAIIAAIRCCRSHHYFIPIILVPPVSLFNIRVDHNNNTGGGVGLFFFFLHALFQYLSQLVMEWGRLEAPIPTSKAGMMMVVCWARPLLPPLLLRHFDGFSNNIIPLILA